MDLSGGVVRVHPGLDLWGFGGTAPKNCLKHFPLMLNTCMLLRLPHRRKSSACPLSPSHFAAARLF